MVGFDGSEEATDALHLAKGIAAAQGAELLVAAVYEPESIFDGGDRQMIPGGDEAARRRRKARFDHLFSLAERELGGATYTRRESWGSAPQALDAMAEADSVDLLVLGSTHRGKLGRILPGGVGERLLNGAPCAVAVAPQGWARGEHFGIGTIGVGYDGRAESRAALGLAVGMARARGASLQILVALSPVPPAGGTGDVPRRYDDLLRAEGARLLEEGAALVPSGLEVERRMELGDAAQVLSEAGVELDLLVIGSRGYGPLRRTLLGGVSSEVMRLAPCPVIVVPRAAHASDGAGDAAARAG